MTGEQPDPPGRSEQRRFTLAARAWVLALVVLAGVLGYLGQFAVMLGAIAIGLVGFLVVFDARRPWWGSGLKEPYPSGKPSADRRTTLAMAGVLVLVTIATVAFVLLSQR